MCCGDCSIPCLISHKGPRSDDTKRQICFLVQIFHYSHDTTLRSDECCKTTASYQSTSQESTVRIHNKRFMELRFGAIVGDTRTDTKRSMAFGNLNPHSNVPDGRNIQLLSTEWARTKINAKEIKKVLDLSKLTLFGVGDRTETITV